MEPSQSQSQDKSIGQSAEAQTSPIVVDLKLDPELELNTQDDNCGIPYCPRCGLISGLTPGGQHRMSPVAKNKYSESEKHKKFLRAELATSSPQPAYIEEGLKIGALKAHTKLMESLKSASPNLDSGGIKLSSTPPRNLVRSSKFSFTPTSSTESINGDIVGENKEDINLDHNDGSVSPVSQWSPISPGRTKRLGIMQQKFMSLDKILEDDYPLNRDGDNFKFDTRYVSSSRSPRSLRSIKKSVDMSQSPKLVQSPKLSSPKVQAQLSSPKTQVQFSPPVCIMRLHQQRYGELMMRNEINGVAAE